jgi:hypothetical protein
MIVGFWVSAKKAKCELKIVNANKRIIDLFLMEGGRNGEGIQS